MDAFVVGSARIAAVAVFVVAIGLGLAPKSAQAVPGELDSTAISLHRSGGSAVSLFDTLPVVRLPGGGYLAFADTTRSHHLGKHTLLLDERTMMKVRKYSSRGRLISTFGRSRIGKGLKIGRSREITDFRGFIPMGSGIYIAWATTTGEIANAGGSRHWPRSTLVAFRASNGSLLTTFGKGGVLIYGSEKYSDSGWSDTSAVAKLADGRILTCGANLSQDILSSTPVHELTRPFAVTTSIGSARQFPFFATGRPTAEMFDSEAGSDFKRCEQVAVGLNGLVYLAGSSGSSRYDFSRKWIDAYRADGSLDTAFGDGGQSDPFAQLPAAVTQDLSIAKVLNGADHSLYVVGRASRTSARGFVARLLPNGDIDESYGRGGVAEINGFAVDDASFSPGGSLFVTGHTAGDQAAAGWLNQLGRWDKNFLGTGWHVYSRADSASLKQLTVGNRVQLWSLNDPATRKTPCTCSGEPLASMDNALTLDSSVGSARMDSAGTIRVRGYASSPIGVGRVEVGVSADGSPPGHWNKAVGTNRWSAVIKRSNDGHGRLWVWTRAVDSNGSVERGFSKKDRNVVLAH